MRRLCSAALAVGLSLAACKTGPNLSTDYGQTARENYELAIGEFTDKDYEEAIQYADFVRIRFPFSRYAVEAELLIARAEFAQGNYTTAQDQFKQFYKLHPTHKHVLNGWCAYMAAVSAYMNAPEGFFLMPPHYQRDQDQLQDALNELAHFFKHYPNSSLNPLAVKLQDEVRRRLLEHELYVAKFYLDRDRPEAAIGRLETAHKEYSGIGLDAEVLFLLALTYLKMDEIELSRTTFAELQAQHPKHHHGRQARLYLKYIQDTYGPADASRKRPDRSPPRPIAPPRPKQVDEESKPGKPKAALEGPTGSL
ncbi:outer membrane protein assembly factor BamD [Nannocystis punicea]|uniref:Outer membrane protein assembly factor BamD n=1 Tax=Nannocystis punicea TaxID=2995304 RepID=A0ABY7H157_9BACT|nr:outer membrane protein assembly factor BamD [Nannocystis poenicansa]WAS92982.1 outer membrane protein assembly factor BamD [Nannocystis poenicansa]